MKKFLCILLSLIFAKFCMAENVNYYNKEMLRVEFVNKIASKEWYKLSAVDIKKKMFPVCVQDKELKLLLTCDANVGVKEFNIIGEHAYEPLTQIVFDDAIGCVSIIKVLQSKLGEPSKISGGKCYAEWNLGKNLKFKKTNVFASIHAPPSGKYMEFNIGSEQGDD